VFTFPQPGFSKFIGVRFAQPHVANIPLAKEICTSFPSAFWTLTKFDLGLLSLSLVSQKIVGVRFPQPHGTNIHIGVVSLGL